METKEKINNTITASVTGAKELNKNQMYFIELHKKQFNGNKVIVLNGSSSMLAPDIYQGACFILDSDEIPELNPLELANKSLDKNGKEVTEPFHIPRVNMKVNGQIYPIGINQESEKFVTDSKYFKMKYVVKVTSVNRPDKKPYLKSVFQIDTINTDAIQ